MTAATLILIPGRTGRQGTTLNEGKLNSAFIEETSTLFMCLDDMTCLGLKNTHGTGMPSSKGIDVELTRA
jgi:formylmethanofuran dehydrogenase subunit D